MALTYIRSLRNMNIPIELIQMGGCKNFAVGSKSKKGGKGGASSDDPKASTISKELKATTVVEANILKDGANLKLLQAEYSEWLWHLLDKRPALSELRRKDIESLLYEDLKCFVKLDNLARIKEYNSVRAKH